MTEKRFRYVDATDEVDEHIIDYGTEPHFEYYTLKGATDKLNELAEENQQLKNDCSILVQSNQEYRKENEQLKSDLAHTKVLYHSLQDKYSGLLRLVHGFNGDVE